MQSSFPYPAMPTGVDERVVQPSATFKKEVGRVAGAIFLFFLVYVGLMAGAVLLAILCGIGGFLLISVLTHFITIMLGLGLVGLGLMVIFFLLKFMFKRHKVDRSGLIEIKEAEQPVLFAFIRKITSETQTPFPKKIYLSPEVNACVFYDSSFWSMFFPVQKNLQIGLGVVNSLNVTEFKAVLAHEFGHFSQRSMKLGSYVYNVNQAIYNMLYDNDGYARALDKWSNASGYFAIFAALTIKVVQGIQWVLQKTYVLVNKPYMSLSREMEFHADAVAAFVTGSDPLVTSLRRTDAAGLCYGSLINYYNSWLPLNLKPDNIYPQHRQMMAIFADQHHIPMQHGLPQVTAASSVYFNPSRLFIKDQWASHPSTDDREAHLVSLNIPHEEMPLSAWELFKDAEQVQQQMTAHLFADVKFEQEPQVVSAEGFYAKFLEDKKARELGEVYNGFYDDRNISAFALEEAVDNVPSKTFEEVFNDATCQLPKQVVALQQDVDLATSISKKETDIKTFDFDGQKYSVKEIAPVLAQLELELKQAQEKLQQADKEAYLYFLHSASQAERSEELNAGYAQLFAVNAEVEEDIALYQEIMEALYPIYNTSMSVEAALKYTAILKQKEDKLKERLKALLPDEIYSNCLFPQQQDRLARLLQEDNAYFVASTFQGPLLDALVEDARVFIEASMERGFQIKKGLLALQLSLMAPASVCMEEVELL